MSGRIEYKYLVPNSMVDQIRAEIAPYMDPDEFGGSRGEYTVRSVYYDTPGWDCYNEKLDGLKLRRKFRIRGYNNPDERSIVFLEIKRKTGSSIAKARAPLLHRDLDAFMETPDLERYILPLSKTDREKRDASSFLYHYYRLGLRPAVLAVYDREAFHGKLDKSLRITFDKDLRGSMFPSLGMLYDNDCLAHAMSKHFTLEVKFFRNSLPAWVVSMLGRYELSRMALSKFTICIDAQRTLRRISRMKSGVFTPVRPTD